MAVWQPDEMTAAEAVARLLARFKRRHEQPANRLGTGGRILGHLTARDIPLGVLLTDRVSGCGPRTIAVWRE